MTTWHDYKVLPADNNSAPPVGAPENHPANQVNNICREMMSVIRQLGDEMDANISGLGTMALQDATAVAITGGAVTATLAGNGAAITNLKAQNLIEGPIPKTIFPPDSGPLDVKVARATTADTVTGGLPIGAIVMWYGLKANVPAGWKVCDGTSGTPDLRQKFPRGTPDDAGKGFTGGADFAVVATELAGNHGHTGVTGATTLTTAQMPFHIHGQTMGVSTDGGAFREQQGGPKSALGSSGNTTEGAGGGGSHLHTISTDGNHVHNVGVTSLPAYLQVWFIMRVS